MSHAPLRIRVPEEQQARAVARELAGVGGLDVSRDEGAWQVVVPNADGDRIVVQVLDAVRRALAGQPRASARILFDGREYHLQGE